MNVKKRDSRWFVPSIGSFLSGTYALARLKGMRDGCRGKSLGFNEPWGFRWLKVNSWKRTGSVSGESKNGEFKLA
jgi:hypothetical protein